uniref:Uncharacterized protein n=1 Tax=Meloidogyne floridensis TaxID=298350 RepID=A0A915NF03_9BILA
KICRKLFNEDDLKYKNEEYQLSILGNNSFIPKELKIKEEQIEQINENINILKRMYLENNLKEVDLKARIVVLNNKMLEVPLNEKMGLLSEIKKEYNEIIQNGKYIIRLGIKEANWLLVEIAYLIQILVHFTYSYGRNILQFLHAYRTNKSVLQIINLLANRYSKFNALNEIGKENFLEKNDTILKNLMILLNLITLLEMYKPLSQKLGYFNREYEERIGLIKNKIKKCIDDHNECLKLSIIRSRKKIKKMDEFEINWNEIIKKFVKNKIGFEIIKVSMLENIQYTGVHIKDFEDLENKGKGYKSVMLSDEERRKRAKIIEMFYYKNIRNKAAIARELGIKKPTVDEIIKRFEEMGTLENRPK